MSIKYRFATNLKDIETRKKHLPSRLKRILVQNKSKLLTNAKPRKSSLFHAWRYLSCRRKCFAGFHFCSHAKKVVKTTRLRRRNFLVVSLVRPLKPICFVFPLVERAKWGLHKRVSSLACLLHCLSTTWMLLLDNPRVQIKAKTRKSLITLNKSKQTRGKALQTLADEIWKLVILHLFFA